MPTGYKKNIMDARDVWHLHSWFQTCLKVCVCVDMLRTNAWRSWPFMQVPKFINNYLSEWTSRMHKFAWEWWPLTCSHALTHTCSNAAEIDCTDHTLQYVLVKYFAILKGEIPGCPHPVPAGCICYNTQFKDRAGHGSLGSLPKTMISWCEVHPCEGWTLLRAVG